MMRVKRVAAGAVMAGMLGAGAFVGAGSASADPQHGCPPWISGPGPGCLPPPGQLQKEWWWPLDGPPGHWPVNPGKVNHW
jgi:hypothetical protein